MNNRRKIGFQAYYDNTQNPEEDEQKKEQAERQKAIAPNLSAITIRLLVLLLRNVTRLLQNWYTIYPISLLSVRQNWLSSLVMQGIM